MKTAVIYSGEARTFGETFPNQWDKVLRLLPSPEFFVSVVDDAQAATMTRLWERFPRESVHVELVRQPKIPEPAAGPKWLQMYPASAAPQAILRQLWALQQAWGFYQSFDHSHDLVVRIRPDLAFMRFELPYDVTRHGTRSSPGEMGLDWCWTPWWSRWGGVNDRLALLGQLAASAYFTTFCRIERLMTAGCALHPETLLDRSLRAGGIVPSHTLATEFVAVRLDGTVTPFDPTTIDVAEYARS